MKWWLRLRLAFIAMQHRDMRRLLDEIDRDRPLVQARLCALQDEHDALLRQLYPASTIQADDYDY